MRRTVQQSKCAGLFPERFDVDPELACQEIVLPRFLRRNKKGTVML